jgi:hypothetical protein
MKITLPLKNFVSDDIRITDNVLSDFKKECQIFIFKDENNCLNDEEEHLYSIWIEYSENNGRGLMFDCNLDDLEMFANSLTKSIEMFRRDYSDLIKERIEKDLPL